VGTKAVTDDATDLAPVEEPLTQDRQRGRLHSRLHAHPLLALTTKVVVGLVGGLVTLVGVVMLVTPGPAFVLIPLGLAILATEFAFARRWLRWARTKAEEAKRRSDAMDPAVRRRRLLLAGVLVLLVVGLVTAYVATYDWPGFAVEGWDWVQSLVGWVPDLPGM
jgi:uncharacterized protein (TIGR02611 family)